MSFQAPISVSDVISRIRSRRLLLPAIQREFVWEPYKVEWLFDSLLQGYPIGSFLFWEIRDQSVKCDYRFYEVLKEFRERYQTHNPEFNTNGHMDFDAVLDGQQRLTALFIGLTGTYAYKKPRVWWEDNERVLPTRKLYLNLISGPSSEDDNEAGRKYEFKFLTDDEVNENTENWFRVGRILDLTQAYELNQMLIKEGYQDNEFAARALSKLHAVVHTERIINYYVVTKADMEQALNVFVRVNSGGEPLSLSDMLMSTAIANWTSRDAKKEILGLVDQVRERGFFISKDLILKACLYLYNSDIRYKVSNFTANKVKVFEDNWDVIHESILAVFDLVHEFGYTESSLTSKNALLPIIYWVHHKAIAKGLTSQVRLRDDRETMRRWLHTMLLKGVFGTHADAILSAIRKAFVGDTYGEPFVLPGIGQFPATDIGTILRTQGKDPQVTDEFIDSLLYTEYEDRQSFTILALLAPNLDYKNGDFNKDHLHPAIAFKNRALSTANVPPDDLDFYRDRRNWNSILNLRYLDANENKSKQDSTLADWVSKESERQKISKAKFCTDRQLPDDVSLLEFARFREFITGRREILRAKLREIL
jgi:uncharacterized protein with ParB-like and HNH nuclease domain